MSHVRSCRNVSAHLHHRVTRLSGLADVVNPVAMTVCFVIGALRKCVEVVDRCEVGGDVKVGAGHFGSKRRAFPA